MHLYILATLGFNILFGFCIAKSDGNDRKKIAGAARQGTDLFGEPHGVEFSDDPTLHTNARISEITLRGCNPGEHLYNIEVTVQYAEEIPNSFHHGHGRVELKYETSFHGNSKGSPTKLVLERGEYIKQVDVTTWQAKTGVLHRSRRTRIGSIKLITNKNQIVSCGSSSPSDPSKSWHFSGYGLLFFSGSAGEAIDALSATFIRMDLY